MDKSNVDKIIPKLKGHTKDALRRIRRYLLICPEHKRVKDYDTEKIHLVPHKDIWLKTFEMKNIKNYPEEEE